MTLFLLVFLTLYAAMHSYLFWKLRAALPHMGRLQWVLAVALVLLVISPIITVLLDRSRYARASVAVGAVAYPWMAMIFWFVVLALLADGWNVLVRLASLAGPQLKSMIIGPGPMLAGIAVLVVAAAAYSFYEAGNIRIRRVTIPVAQLPPGLARLKIAQVSDVHLGLHTLPSRFAQAIALIEQEAPDMLVSTGDLVDSSFHNIRHFADDFARIRPRLGKYAVLGNHEFYAGFKNSLEFHEQAGFTVLAGDSVLLDGQVRLAGVDDPAGGRQNNPRVDELLALPPDKSPLTILLKHQPVVFGPSAARMDLQLSGHTHGGQVFPFHLITRMIYPLCRGLHALPGGGHIYTSNGTGAWGPPMRLGAEPEVTIITFVPASAINP